MNHQALIRRMAHTPEAIRALVADLTVEEARYKPPSGAWSILEIVCHLGDEEVDDFRARLQSLMEDPAAPWPGTHPEQWAIDKRYNGQDLGAALERFTRERGETLKWLRSLKDPDWNTAYLHPRIGPVPAGELMASWPAHDALHVRQIAKRLYELAGREGYSVRYAGEWGA